MLSPGAINSFVAVAFLVDQDVGFSIPMQTSKPAKGTSDENVRCLHVCQIIWLKAHRMPPKSTAENRSARRFRVRWLNLMGAAFYSWF